MADLGDVLRHLVSLIPGLSDINRQEYTEAVNEEYPPPAQPEPEPESAPEPVPDPEITSRDAEIASLKAQVAEAQKLAAAKEGAEAKEAAAAAAATPAGDSAG